jgi:hypothetical protein
MDRVLREEQVLRPERGIQVGTGKHPRLSRSSSPHRARRESVHEDLEVRRALALSFLQNPETGILPHGQNYTLVLCHFAYS